MANAHYSGPERRQHSRTVDQVELAFDQKLRDHEIREAERIQVFIAALKLEAFPDGAEAHRRAHQAMIDAAKSEEAFWAGLKTEIAKKSIWGILHILVILVIAGVAAKLGLASLFGVAIK